jgi:hypothetical protein
MLFNVCGSQGPEIFCLETRKLWKPPHPFSSDTNVNGAGSVCNQKSSKFFVSSREESITGHMCVNGIY